MELTMGELDHVSLALGRIEAKVDAAMEELKEQQRVTSDLTAVKNRGIGLLVGVGLLAGTTGAAIKSAIASIIE